MEEQEVPKTSWALVGAEEAAPEAQVGQNYFFGDQLIAYSWAVMLGYLLNDSESVVVVVVAAVVVTIVFLVEPYNMQSKFQILSATQLKNMKKKKYIYMIYIYGFSSS